MSVRKGEENVYIGTYGFSGFFSIVRFLKLGQNTSFTRCIFVHVSPYRQVDENMTDRKILLLHGDRQTGQILLGRVGALKKKLKRNGITLVAPDGPFPWKLDPSVHVRTSIVSEEDQAEDDMMRTWWYRDENEYCGLETTLQNLEEIWNNESGMEGIIGFSRGARLTHLIAHLHHTSKGMSFPNLKYVIIASGYGNVPMPTNFNHSNDTSCLSMPSMHIYGKNDRLVTPSASRALLNSYIRPLVHEHDGGHYIPMRADDVAVILSFIMKYSNEEPNQENESISPSINVPDEEHAQIQKDECESLAMIFPDEFQLLTPTEGVELDEYGQEHIKYKHPISYSIQLSPAKDILDQDPEMASLWPSKSIGLKITYTATYPDSSPIISLHHDMNLLEFKLSQSKACIEAIQEVANQELGMPCVMSCVYKGRDFFENGGLAASLTNVSHDEKKQVDTEMNIDEVMQENLEGKKSSLLQPSTKKRIKECIEEGLQIANSILGHQAATNDAIGPILEDRNIGKGGSWRYTIGLVGKPSAGKSTFFNAATGFARQRGGNDFDEDGIAIGGAAMAPHPFTTIDPNVGFCLVPAPQGSCPEDDFSGDISEIACTHGRDGQNRRLIPVMLKDVAGLVPGAYQGRGKGNAFLNDLTDADVLIHVLDSSGSSDAEGNKVLIDTIDSDATGASNPIDDLDWIFNELIQWVYSNIENKWDTVQRRGHNKLASMFSGYKQSQAFVWDVLMTVEKYLYKKEGRKNSLDHLNEWDEGDLYRLVAAFLGSRFPVALALNKVDLPTSALYCKQILDSLPYHGAHNGTPMSAHQEMKYVRKFIYAELKKEKYTESNDNGSAPHQVLNCLQSSITLREPVLAFPVADMESYAPLPGLNEYATSDPSLPNAGMIACLNASGGASPSFWDAEMSKYTIRKPEKCLKLRDVLTLKPGSTIEDCFLVLKWYGAIGGEFVRAEAACNIGDKPKPVKKDDLIGRHNRIIKIMTTRRREWQKKM